MYAYLHAGNGWQHVANWIMLRMKRHSSIFLLNISRTMIQLKPRRKARSFRIFSYSNKEIICETFCGIDVVPKREECIQLSSKYTLFLTSSPLFTILDQNSRQAVFIHKELGCCKIEQRITWKYPRKSQNIVQ